MYIGLRSSWDNRLGNVGLNLIASVFANQWVPDLGSGLRIIHCDTARRYVRILPNGFDFNTALTMALLADGMRVGWFEADVKERLWGESHVNKWRDGSKALWQIIRIGGALRTRKPRAWLRRFRLTSRS
jgi:hypothetical protein